MAADKPMRIVSLDYCADQYVLKLADREQILAISPSAVKDFSYMRDEAVGVPTVRPIAEDVLILKPDLVVRSFGGGPNASTFFERAGIPVLQVGWASNVDSEELGSIPTLIQDMADGLGQTERGTALVSEFRQRLAAIQERQSDANALYMTPAGVTSGPGSLVHEMMVTAGLKNFQEQAGWRSLPLERLAYEQPDVIVASFFETLTNHPNAWSAAKHPVARKQLDGPDVVALQGAWTACGGWFILDAIEALAEDDTP
ncbi:MAG: ABC transporter substrate-binding protein [Pseudomonadota bacterium]